MTTVREDDGVTTLLGFRSPAAWVVVVVNVLGVIVSTAWTLDGIRQPAVVAVALVLHAASVVLLVRVPGDPLPFRTTAFITLYGPLASALVLFVLPVPIDNPLQPWPTTAAVGVYTFLCVRGRTPWAWAGLVAIFAVTITWSTLTGQGPLTGFLIVLPNVALVLMGSFFAYALRTPVADIFRLRLAGTRQAADQAASRAVLDERDAQLTRLDVLARPLLSRIASGEPLSDEERIRCQLLEHHLRDSVRAKGLDIDEVHSAAREARSRGVDVLLFDDRGETDTTVHRDIVAAVIDALHGSASSVTVRLRPGDQDVAASIVVTTADGVEHWEFDRSGTRLSS
ncbi:MULTISPECIES: hypothetical protein [Nocardiaceae]|uniref:Uncharacterized protein n=1 Tax=Rhodococcoides corynebacterioides TaxID=53972 RepID=A0ABS2KVE5_9NOCA|nr:MULTISPECIES: hypothetical protein [Rhodococcus]MBM7415888.1 hypothetical protein [Rhodococcus corynebacterioides]MBP1118350.1 hypothetical protein [Rhodococcus sp. PvP016]